MSEAIQAQRQEALQYRKEDLLANVARCDKNIQTFEDAIGNERMEKARLMEMVAIIEAHERAMAKA